MNGMLFNELDKLTQCPGNRSALLLGAPGEGITRITSGLIVEEFCQGRREQILVLDLCKDFMEIGVASCAGFLNPVKKDRFNICETLPSGYEKFNEIALMAFVEAAMGGALEEDDTDIVLTAYKQILQAVSTPTIGDIVQALRKESAPRAQMLALALEIYADPQNQTGQLFASQRTEQENHCMVIYDLAQCAAHLQEIMAVCSLHDMIRHMITNSNKGIRTAVYIAHVHLLLQSPTASKLLNMICEHSEDLNSVIVCVDHNLTSKNVCHEGKSVLEHIPFLFTLGLASDCRQFIDAVFDLEPGSCPAPEEQEAYMRWSADALPYIT